MKKLFIAALLLLMMGRAAPGQRPVVVNGSITAQDAGSCVTAGSCVVVSVLAGNTNPASSTFGFAVGGTFSATLKFLQSSDGTNFVASYCIVPGTPGTAVTQTTVAGQWRCDVAGAVLFAVEASTYTSGTATVKGALSNSVSTSLLRSATGGGGSGCVPAGSVGQILADSGSGGCSDSLSTDNGTTMTYTGTGGYSAPKLVSTVAIGTSPLTVTSTTVVPNLNVALLNGSASAPPNGAAGGGLAGTYPNPTVGSVPCSALPALTGDTTNSAGACATTTGQVNGAVIPTSAKVAGTNASKQFVAATSADILGVCTTCVTSAAALTNNQLVFGAGGQASASGDLTGDVTTAGAKATTIANNAVTLAKMATQAANTILGNYTSGSAAPTAGAAPSGGTSGCAGSTDAVIYTTNTGWGCHQISGGSGVTTMNYLGKVATSALIGGTDNCSINFADNTTLGCTYASLADAGQPIGASTVKALFVHTEGNQGASQTITVTVTKNGADTTMTCAITTGASDCNDTTHTFSVIDTDLLAYKVVGTATLTGNSTSFLLKTTN